jgi:hypothetical protein
MVEGAWCAVVLSAAVVLHEHARHEWLLCHVHACPGVQQIAVHLSWLCALQLCKAYRHHAMVIESMPVALYRQLCRLSRIALHHSRHCMGCPRGGAV